MAWGSRRQGTNAERPKSESSHVPRHVHFQEPQSYPHKDVPQESRYSAVSSPILSALFPRERR